MIKSFLLPDMHTGCSVMHICDFKLTGCVVAIMVREAMCGPVDKIDHDILVHIVFLQSAALYVI